MRITNIESLKQTLWEIDSENILAERATLQITVNNQGEIIEGAKIEEITLDKELNILNILIVKRYEKTI